MKGVNPTWLVNRGSGDCFTLHVHYRGTDMALSESYMESMFLKSSETNANNSEENTFVGVV